MFLLTLSLFVANEANFEVNSIFTILMRAKLGLLILLFKTGGDLFDLDERLLLLFL